MAQVFNMISGNCIFEIQLDLFAELSMQFCHACLQLYSLI